MYPTIKALAKKQNRHIFEYFIFLDFGPSEECLAQDSGGITRSRHPTCQSRHSKKTEHSTSITYSIFQVHPFSKDFFQPEILNTKQDVVRTKLQLMFYKS